MDSKESLMFNPMIAADQWRLFGILGWKQLLGLLLLVILIIFWLQYRKRQM
jgi:hypothetical protein